MSTPELKPETPITDADNLSLLRKSLEVLAINRGQGGDKNVEESIMYAVVIIRALENELTATQSALNAAREAIEFVLDECDWNRGDSDQPFGGGDERIGPALSAALAQIDKALSP